jgi:SAM-dependent methyltransferase
MPSWQLLQDLRSYYRGCQGRDLRMFYDLESRLPYFDHVSRILCAHKRRILLRWIQQQPVRGPIVEIGSGIGTFARQLARHGYTVVAVDISPAKTRKARRYTAKRRRSLRAPVRHLVGDVCTLGTGMGLDAAIQRACQWQTWKKFDVLLAADVLEHVSDPPRQTLQRLASVLAPGGRLLTSVPSKLCLKDPGHYWTLLPEEWEHVFAASDFVIQRRQMSRLCWYGLPTPLPLAMVYELRLDTTISSRVAS